MLVINTLWFIASVWLDGRQG